MLIENGNYIFEKDTKGNTPFTEGMLSYPEVSPAGFHDTLIKEYEKQLNDATQFISQLNESCSDWEKIADYTLTLRDLYEHLKYTSHPPSEKLTPHGKKYKKSINESYFQLCDFWKKLRTQKSPEEKEEAYSAFLVLQEKY